MRGVEFKTNTTNKAIETYQSNTQTRLDEKIDAVEDFIGAIGWKIAQLCVSRMESEEVGRMIGSRFAEIWEQRPDYEDFKTYGSCQCVGGSTLKPTSATKQQQAIQIGQVLGQFANVTPVTFLVALKVMARAFDDIIITDADWKMIEQAVEQALQGQQAQQQGKGQGGGGEPGLEEVEQMINGLPPQAKALLGQMLARGTPIRDAMAAIMKKVQGMQGAQAAQQQQQSPEGAQPMPNGAQDEQAA
jgi:hypothetical protein